MILQSTEPFIPFGLSVSPEVKSRRLLLSRYTPGYKSGILHWTRKLRRLTYFTFQPPKHTHCWELNRGSSQEPTLYTTPPPRPPLGRSEDHITQMGLRVKKYDNTKVSSLEEQRDKVEGERDIQVRMSS